MPKQIMLTSNNLIQQHYLQLPTFLQAHTFLSNFDRLLFTCSSETSIISPRKFPLALWLKYLHFNTSPKFPIDYSITTTTNLKFLMFRTTPNRSWKIVHPHNSPQSVSIRIHHGIPWYANSEWIRRKTLKTLMYSPTPD